MNDSDIKWISKPLSLKRFVRTLPGGTRSVLAELSDDREYVLKFLCNPQTHRSLVNELLGTEIFRSIGLPVPQLRQVFLTSTQESDAAAMRGHTRNQMHASNFCNFQHLAVSIPVNRNEATLYDILPEMCHVLLQNKSDMLGALVVDQWLGNLDIRQTVFAKSKYILRDRVSNAKVGSRIHSGMIGIFIDHGLCFGGKDWSLREIPVKYGPKHNLGRYECNSWLSILRKWCQRVEAFPDEDLRNIFALVPSSWLLHEDVLGLQLLHDQLRRRRDRIRIIQEDLIKVWEEMHIGQSFRKMPCFEGRLTSKVANYSSQ